MALDGYVGNLCLSLRLSFRAIFSKLMIFRIENVAARNKPEIHMKYHMRIPLIEWVMITFDILLIKSTKHGSVTESGIKRMMAT